jgi:hypothetical protein
VPIFRPFSFFEQVAPSPGGRGTVALQTKAGSVPVNNVRILLSPAAASRGAFAQVQTTPTNGVGIPGPLNVQFDASGVAQLGTVGAGMTVTVIVPTPNACLASFHLTLQSGTTVLLSTDVQIPEADCDATGASTECFSNGGSSRRSHSHRKQGRRHHSK